MNGVGKPDTAWFGQRFDPRRYIDAIAVDIFAINHHVAEIDADAVKHFSLVRKSGVALGHHGLHFDRTQYSLCDTWELPKFPIPGGAHDAAAMFMADWDGSVSMPLQRRKRAILISSHEPRVARHVDCDNGGKPSLRAAFRHNPSPRLGPSGNANKLLWERLCATEAAFLKM